MGKHSKRDQYYAFTMPESACSVWVELFLGDGTHTVAPSPYMDMHWALKYLREEFPRAVVDELDDPRDLEQVRGWAATMPLEQLPVSASLGR